MSNSYTWCIHCVCSGEGHSTPKLQLMMISIIALSNFFFFHWYNVLHSPASFFLSIIIWEFPRMQTGPDPLWFVNTMKRSSPADTRFVWRERHQVFNCRNHFVLLLQLQEGARRQLQWGRRGVQTGWRDAALSCWRWANILFKLLVVVFTFLCTTTCSYTLYLCIYGMTCLIGCSCPTHSVHLSEVVYCNVTLVNGLHSSPSSQVFLLINCLSLRVRLDSWAP